LLQLTWRNKDKWELVEQSQNCWFSLQCCRDYSEWTERKGYFLSFWTLQLKYRLSRTRSHLLLTNVLFMFGTGASTIWKVCYIIVVVLHYLWLSVFSFMTISVIYIMARLLQMTSQGTRQEEDIARRRQVITGMVRVIIF
jgi:hypothetical protein